MSLRITQRMMTDRSLTAMQTGMERLSRSQEKLSTGRLINRPSDSPTGTNSAMRLREQLSATAQHSRNASDGLAWLGRVDNTLTSMLDQTRRARDLVVQANTGAAGEAARLALAGELTQIRESLLAQANTQHLGRPIFGGTTGNPAAYTRDPATGAIAFGQPGGPDPGTPGHLHRSIGAGVSVRISTLGPEAFGPDGANLFDALDKAIGALTGANGAQPGDALADLDTVMKRMTTALADVGTRYGRVESALASLSSSTLDVQSMLSEVENVDVARAIVDLQLQEVAYQAALGATVRVLQPSLIDFLR